MRDIDARGGSIENSSSPTGVSCVVKITSSPFRFGAPRVVLPAFCIAIFLSAFLLFSVQPMFTKLVLPKLGGTPAVWSVAMVFFQAVLLTGYA